MIQSDEDVGRLASAVPAVAGNINHSLSYRIVSLYRSIVHSLINHQLLLFLTFIAID
jgi:hypothetical protein